MAALMAAFKALMAAFMASSSAFNPFLPCTRHTELVPSSTPVSASPIAARVEPILVLFCRALPVALAAAPGHCCSQVSSTGKGRGVLSISAPAAPQFHKTYPANINSPAKTLQQTPER